MNLKLKEKRIRIGNTVVILKPKTQITIAIITVCICTVIGLIINENTKKLIESNVISDTDLHFASFSPYTSKPYTTPPASSSATNTEKIIIHVSGAVKKPGLIHLNAGARVADAIDAAGGALENSAVESMNLASYVYDGMKIYVPHIGETPYMILTATPSNGANSSGINSSENIKVNINTAGITELMQLSGIGESTAKKIIAYREEFGDFQKIEDILQVSGIGDAKFSTIKDQIYV